MTRNKKYGFPLKKHNLQQLEFLDILEKQKQSAISGHNPRHNFIIIWWWKRRGKKEKNYYEDIRKSKFFGEF